METVDYRLPRTVRPVHYDLTFKTDLKRLEFLGYYSIYLDVLSDTNVLVCNVAYVILSSEVKVTDSTGTSHAPIRQAKDSKLERISFYFSKKFSKGSRITLHIGGKGVLGTNIAGYYSSVWTDADGKQRRYASTMLAPTFARNAFPCWDEPLLKARFKITMISRADTVNLSNMPVESETLLSQTSLPAGVPTHLQIDQAEKNLTEWKITVFKKTPPMSTYLVALANGHFEYLEDSYTSPLTGKTRPLRIYATPDVVSQAKFALDIKVKVVPLYEQVFDVEFPLPKLDTIVVDNFYRGGMESWGLIIGGSSAYLYDSEKSDFAAKRVTAMLQIHEVGHMWFGDITTMSWWDSTFLNEGMATLMGDVIILSKLFPEWHPHSYFINHSLERALRLDSLRSSHPIQVNLPDPSQIVEFDGLSYSKAASVLYMLSQYIGEKNLLQGVSLYLKDHLFGNAEPEDLWRGISKASGIDVAKIMDPWLTKIGFPVLTVTESSGKLVIRQDRFLASGDPTAEENQTIWPVPLAILSTDNCGNAVVDQSAVLNSRSTTIALNSNKPFKLNAGTMGVYRVAYSAELWSQISQWAAQSDTIYTLDDRMGLVSDAMILAQAGIGKTSSALKLLELLHGEREQLVWQAIASSLRPLDNLLLDQNLGVREQLNAFQRFLFIPIVERLGYDYLSSDSPDVRELRTLAINSAAGTRDPAVITELMDRFTRFIDSKDPRHIPVDLQPIIYAAAVKHGGHKEYSAVKDLWRGATTPSTSIAALRALCAVEDPEVARTTLRFMLEELSSPDWRWIFEGMSSNRIGRRELVAFFKHNYTEIMKRFGGGYELGSVVNNTFSSFSSDKDLWEIEHFFSNKDLSGYEMALKQSLDSIRTNIAWLERDRKDIVTFLGDFERRHRAATHQQRAFVLVPLRSMQ